MRRPLLEEFLCVWTTLVGVELPPAQETRLRIHDRGDQVSQPAIRSGRVLWPQRILKCQRQLQLHRSAASAWSSRELGLTLRLTDRRLLFDVLVAFKND